MKNNGNDDNKDDIRIELNPKIPLSQHFANAMTDQTLSRDARAVYAAMVVKNMAVHDTELAAKARLAFNETYPGLLRERAKTP